MTNYDRKVRIEFTPIVGIYIIRTRSRFEVGDEEGRLVEDKLKRLI